jgi:alanyl-tRNA synthetase
MCKLLDFAYAPINQILQTLITNIRKLGKAAYLFSPDADSKRINHVNVVPEPLKTKGLDAQGWANAVSAILGGKVSCHLYLMTLSH